MCGTQFTRPSGDRITVVALPKKRLSITKNYINNAPKEDTDIQLGAKIVTVKNQIHELHEESNQAQLPSQEQNSKMHKDSVRLAKIINLGVNLVDLQEQQRQNSYAENKIGLKRARSSSTSSKNARFEVKSTSLTTSHSTKQFFGHGKFVSMFSTRELANEDCSPST